MTMTIRRTAPGIAAAALAGALLLTACSTDAEPAAEAETPTASSPAASSAASDAPGIAVSSSEDRDPTAGDPDLFTGEVSILPLYDPNDASTGGAGQVTFQPGARTAWHAHPAGQRLIITDGTGWIQQ